MEHELTAVRSDLCRDAAIDPSKMRSPQEGFPQCMWGEVSRAGLPGFGCKTYESFQLLRSLSGGVGLEQVEETPVFWQTHMDGQKFCIKHQCWQEFDFREVANIESLGSRVASES